MPRGGRRAGAPGKAYPNRVDLNAPKTLAPTAAPGQTYGAAGAQLASQQVVPMGNPSLPSAPQAQAAPPLQPGSLGHILRPTEMPEQPLTHGAPFGAGPGPPPAPMPQGPAQNAAAVLNQLSDTDLPDRLKILKQQLNTTNANQGAF